MKRGAGGNLRRQSLILSVRRCLQSADEARDDRLDGVVVSIPEEAELGLVGGVTAFVQRSIALLEAFEIPGGDVQEIHARGIEVLDGSSALHADGPVEEVVACVDDQAERRELDHDDRQKNALALMLANHLQLRTVIVFEQVQLELRESIELHLGVALPVHGHARAVHIPPRRQSLHSDSHSISNRN